MCVSVFVKKAVPVRMDGGGVKGRRCLLRGQFL